MAEIIYRKATIEDAKGIAKVNVDAWKESFCGVVNQEYLDALSYKKRTADFSKRFTDGGFYRIFVAEKGSKTVGFADFGTPRENENQYDAELYAIYVLPDYQGKGIGKKLL